MLRESKYREVIVRAGCLHAPGSNQILILFQVAGADGDFHTREFALQTLKDVTCIVIEKCVLPFFEVIARALDDLAFIGTVDPVYVDQPVLVYLLDFLTRLRVDHEDGCFVTAKV